MTTCPACGRANPEDARFCNACGAAVEATPRAGGEERKTVTVVFVDLVGFTAQAERLDPEDVRALLTPYHARARTELERHGGTVEKFIGDAVMAVFGAPVAHEDDPERAVRAALAIRDWIREEAAELQLRLGIATGEALVTLGARPGQGEAMVAGDVVNTAARLQSAAPVNGILVAEPTHRATAHIIDYATTEPVIAKGKAAPVRAWQALGAIAAPGVGVTDGPIAPLVGRERELDLLISTLGRVREDRAPQLVTVVGVPGIGKTRLARELWRAVEQEDELTWLQGRSLPYGEGVTFWALGEIVKAHVGVLESDDADVAGAKLHASAHDLATDPAEADWFEDSLRPLIGLGDAGGGDPSAAWRRFLEALAQRGPLVLAFEDLHWADDALLDFVDDLVDRAGEIPLLVLATARPELLARRPGWGGGKPNAFTLSLAALSAEGTAWLLDALLGPAMSGAAEQQALLSRVGGNPLYAEQYARALSEGQDTETLPDTLQGLIAARIDGLTPDEKRVVQDAAVVGTVFWAGALEAVGGSPSSNTEEVLRRLERKQFVRRAPRSSVGGETEYAFRHVLLRDVAYGQIPRAGRAERHLRAAEWLEPLGRTADHADMLADHYLRALDYQRAAGRADASLQRRAHLALRDAGDRSHALAGYAAAARSFEAALALAPSDGTDRAACLLRLGRARFAAESGGAPELEAAYDAFLAAGDPEQAVEAALQLRSVLWYGGDRSSSERWLARAQELVIGRPDSPAKALVLVDRMRTLQVANRYHETIQLGVETLPLVERLGLGVAHVWALNARGVARVELGDAGGLDDLERATALAEDMRSIELLHSVQNNAADSQFVLGHVEEAAVSYDALFESVERFGRDTDRRWVDASMASLRASQGRWDEALALADRFLAGVDAGAPHYLEAPCRASRAAIRLARADLAGALADGERAAQAGRAARDPQVLVPALEAHASALCAAGSRDEAQALLEELLACGQDIMAGVSGFGTAIVGIAWLARDLGREQELLAVVEGMPELPWLIAARAIADGEAAQAASRLAEIGCPPAEAYTRLRLAGELAASGRHADAEGLLDAALAFHRRVGAVRFIELGEALRLRVGRDRQPARGSKARDAPRRRGGGG